jgi:hypothetical protein
MFWREEDEASANLDLLSETSEYQPNLPLELKASEEMGRGKYLIVEGNVGTSFDQLPTIVLEDSNGDMVLSLTIDPSYSYIELKSDLKVKCDFFG